MTAALFLAHSQVNDLFDLLRYYGYQVVGPQVSQGVICYQPLQSADQLPWGWQDTQSPGSYRLSSSSDNTRCFACLCSMQGIKPWLFRPEQTLWRVVAKEDGLGFESHQYNAVPIALIGCRACDLAALKLQDQHFMQGEYLEAHYAKYREQLLLIAVNCHQSAATCFCVSTGDGPEVVQAYDLCLDEVSQGFVVQIGSEKGQALLAPLSLLAASQQHLAECEIGRQQARKQQRSLPSRDLRSLLYSSQNKSDFWQAISERCLSCGNCTAVCPTCFCSRTDDEAALDGSSATRIRRWDSCFSDEHSYIVGKVIRKEGRDKYRQWLTHKLATWHEQYGRSGCVGCGRCITWCPVGIDLVAEVNKLAQLAVSEANKANKANKAEPRDD